MRARSRTAAMSSSLIRPPTDGSLCSTPDGATSSPESGRDRRRPLTASIQRCLRVGGSAQVADGLHTLLPVQTAGNLGLRRLHHGVAGASWGRGVDEAGLDRAVPWVIFDGDCAFCTSSAHWIGPTAESPRRARMPSWCPGSSPTSTALGTTAERAQREALWVGTDGAIYGGAAAFAEWLRFRGGGYAVAGQLCEAAASSFALASAVYRLIAKNRHRMPGGSPACALPPPGFDPAQPGTKAL